MASYFRKIVAEKILSSAVKCGVKPSSVSEVDLLRSIRVNFAWRRDKHPQLVVSHEALLESLNQAKNNTDLIKDIKNSLCSTDDVVRMNTAAEAQFEDQILFSVNNLHSFTKKVLEESKNPQELPNTSCILNTIQQQKVLLDYSSPNIAKIFHVGHLRSTIIGNFIAKLHTYLGHQVIQINYLGDWGTQYGLLCAGFEKFGSEESLVKDPISHLQEVYVMANKLAETDAEFREKARVQFHKLENGEKETLSQWQRFRDLSIQKYKSMYNQLGIEFDHFHGESMYSSGALEVIHELQRLGLAQRTEDGAVVCNKIHDFKQDRTITLSKSDGSTLYLTRDIAAAIDRKQKYNFDKAYYVVDNSQRDHFIALKAILREMGHSWYETLHHIGFGRIQGMSTRKGQVVTLESLLDEAKDLAFELMQRSPNTKVTGSSQKDVAEVLGITAVLINDMQSRRNKEYSFKWEVALKEKGDTGFSVQYAHARLHGLEKNCGVDPRPDCDISQLVEPEAINLMTQISRFDEVLYRSYVELEPCFLVSYLFQMRHAIAKALKVLPVKGEELSVAQARLRLFLTARSILAQGMKILGLKPLNEM